MTYNNPSTEPLFNSGLAYLENIHKLIQASQEAYVRRDFESMHSVLSLWHGVIRTRMSKEQSDKSMEYLKNSYNKTLSMNFIQEKRERFKKGVLFNWYCYLNDVSHELGLIMPNKPSELEAVDYGFD